MKTEIRDVLKDIFISNIEKLAFMFAEAAESSEIDAVSDTYIDSRITFKGEFSGEMHLIVPKEMLTEIAANVLGMDESDEMVVERGADAIKEVLNVTCGHFLTSYAGDKVVFDLTPPEISTIDQKKFIQKINDDVLAFLVDDNPALLSVEIK